MRCAKRFICYSTFMKSTKNTHAQVYKLIASHALAVGIATNIFLLASLSDLYRILTSAGDASVPIFDESVYGTLSLISSSALLIAILSYSYYLLKKRAS